MRSIGIAVTAAGMIASTAWADGSASGDALHWLSLLDRGDYAASWTDAGTLFKSQVTEPDWTGKVEPLRLSVGAVVTRALGAEQDAKTLPGAPDGDYKIIHFNTAFAHKQAAVETVVLAKQPDGWKVDGYFIK